MTALVGVVVLVAAAPAAIVLLIWRLSSLAARRLDAWLCRKQHRVAWQKLMRFDPQLGFAMRAGLDCHSTPYEGSDPFHIETCSNGWPGKNELAGADIIVVGDSLAAGNGVDIEQAYFSGDEDGLRVKAVGCSGYSMVHGLLLIRRLAAQNMLKDKLVVWLVCLGNDLADNWSPALDLPMPFATLDAAPGEWRIVTDHLTDSPWRCGSGRFRTDKATARATLDYYSSGYAAERGFQIAAGLIQDAATHVGAAAGRLSVLGVPYQSSFLPERIQRRHAARIGVANSDWDIKAVDTRLALLCSRVGLRYTSGLEVFRFGSYLSVGEDHWNERGHRRFRKWLAREYLAR